MRENLQNVFRYRIVPIAIALRDKKKKNLHETAILISEAL